MPENESLDALLRKGDPAGEPSGPRNGEDRFALLAPKLVEDAVPVGPMRSWHRAWLAVPALALSAVAVALIGRPEAPAVPLPSATPVMIVKTSPTPLPIVKPTPAVEKKVTEQKAAPPEVRKPQRRYRRKWRVAAEFHRPRRKHSTYVRRRVRPTAPTNTINADVNVERIVIDRTVVPTSRVAIVITGNGENLSVTRALLEEKS